MCVKINVKVATSSVKHRGFPLNILLILLKTKINNDHFLKLHIFKKHNLVFWLFIWTGHIFVKTVPSSLSDTYLFVCCLTSQLRICHSSTTSLFSMRGFKILIYAWHMWHWSKYWLLLHNTCCYTKPRWLWSHLKDRPNFFTIFAKHGILSIYDIRDRHGTTDNEKYSEVREKILHLNNYDSLSYKM